MITEQKLMEEILEEREYQLEKKKVIRNLWETIELGIEAEVVLEDFKDEVCKGIAKRIRVLNELHLLQLKVLERED